MPWSGRFWDAFGTLFGTLYGAKSVHHGLVQREKATADLDQGRIVVRAPFSYLLLCRGIPGAGWDRERRAWTYPATRGHAQRIVSSIPGIEISERVAALLAARVGPPAERQPRPAPPPEPKPEPEPLIEPPAGLKTKPWRHQVAAYQFAMERFSKGFAGVLLAIIMGGGKSLSALMLLLGLRAQRVLIACPLRVIPVWIAQLERHLSTPMVVVALDEDAGSVADKQRLAEEKLRLADATGRPFVCVINFDSIWREPFGSWGERQQWDVVVADECVPAGTRIATPAGDRPIESIQVGDKVLGFKHEMRTVIVAEVQATFRRRTQTPLVEVGPTRLTPEHPVWVETKGYRPAVEISNQDYVRRINADGRVEVRRVRDLLPAGEALAWISTAHHSPKKWSGGLNLCRW